MLAKLQPHYLSSLTTMPHQQNTYETMLRALHWHRPNIGMVMGEDGEFFVWTSSISSYALNSRVDRGRVWRCVDCG